MWFTSSWIPALRCHARRGIAIATIAVGTPVVLGAQNTARRDEPIAPFSTLYLTTGTLLMDVGKLNPHFSRVDLPAEQRPGFDALSNDGYSIGIGGYAAVISRFVLGAEWHSADMGQESSPTGKTNQLTTSYWMGTAGYAAWTLWKFNFIPFAGIGMGTAKLTLQNRNGGQTVSDAVSPTFDEVIASPGSKSTMTGTYVMVQPGLAIDLLVLREEANRVGLTIGLRFATAITPNRTTWKYGGSDVFGGPDLGPTGGTVRVIAGIGGFRLAP